MAVCLACAELTAARTPLCDGCRGSLRRGSRLDAGQGLLVRSALHHSGPARRLVHRLKYEGVARIADLLAERMATLLPGDAAVLVPVPRAAFRRARYGVDPAWELARALSRCCGLPVGSLLRAAPWWPRHAVRERSGRRSPRFGARGPVGEGVVLVDDVATTGSTLLAAARALGGDVRHGLVATSPGTMPRPAPVEAGEVAWR